MSWIKRNLVFVVCGALGVVLLGLSGWYVFSQMQADQASTEAFDNALKTLQDSQTATPFPSDQNIELAKKDKQRAEETAAAAKSMFPSFQKYSGLSDQNFKNYIENSVDQLQRQAKQFGVTLPPDYYFTFSSFRKLMQFDQEFMPAWIEQMEEIKTLVGVLIKARVNSIDAMRRIAVSDVDSSDNWTDFMNGIDSVTNAGVIRTPYEITFSSFSAELAGVLEGFMRSSNCFLIKNLQVSQSDIEVVQFVDPTLEAPSINGPLPPSVAPPPAVYDRRTADQQFFERYHVRRPRSTEPMPPPKPVAPPVTGPPKPPPPPITVLTEKPLRVTIFLEILKLQADASPAQRGPKSRPSRAP